MSDRKPLKYSDKRRRGNLGEDVVVLYLGNSGYKIIERNYQKKWGEIDIVVSKNSTIHFIEVKSSVTREKDELSVSRNISQDCFTASNFNLILSRETDDTYANHYRPEENVTKAKKMRINRAIQTFIAERNIGDDIEWQVDVITARIDYFRKTAIIDHVEGVILD